MIIVACLFCFAVICLCLAAGIKTGGYPRL